MIPVALVGRLDACESTLLRVLQQASPPAKRLYGEESRFGVEYSGCIKDHGTR